MEGNTAKRQLHIFCFKSTFPTIGICEKITWMYLRNIKAYNHDAMTIAPSNSFMVKSGPWASHAALCESLFTARPPSDTSPASQSQNNSAFLKLP